jgi:hypothetical protein
VGGAADGDSGGWGGGGHGLVRAGVSLGSDGRVAKLHFGFPRGERSRERSHPEEITDETPR